MKVLILVACLLAFGQAKPVWITLSESTLEQLKTLGNVISVHRQQPISTTTYQQLIGNEALHIAQVDDTILPALAYIRNTHGSGYVIHSSFVEAFHTIQSLVTDATRVAVTYPAIKNDPKTKELINQAKATEIVSTISTLSSYNDRKYNSENGANASKWIANRWQELAGERKDVAVELFKHPKWVQQSVILTLQGTDANAGIVIIGGHMDSTAFFTTTAPGADDNASGTSSVTEALRVFLANNFKPRRTMKFMAYAAEEPGDLGSAEVAKQFKQSNAKIAGVLQMDMTNFKASTGDIYIITDYTNAEQNKYVTDLANTYLPELTISQSKCGYACSDHASWTAQGYRASFPFESDFTQLNPKIHTSQDTLANSDPTGNHALKFAKLAIAFGAELANSDDFQNETN